MLRVPLVASTGRAGYWLERLVALVVVAVAHRKAWPQLLGHDLDGRAGAAVLGSPAPLLEAAQDHDPAALASDCAVPGWTGRAGCRIAYDHIQRLAGYAE
jgi:hypothetical protein